MVYRIASFFQACRYLSRGKTTYRMTELRVVCLRCSAQKAPPSDQRVWIAQDRIYSLFIHYLNLSALQSWIVRVRILRIRAYRAEHGWAPRSPWSADCAKTHYSLRRFKCMLEIQASCYPWFSPSSLSHNFCKRWRYFCLELVVVGNLAPSWPGFDRCANDTGKQ